MHSVLQLKGEWLPDVVAGIPKEKIREAADMMKSGRFGIIFFGMGVTQSLSKNHNIDIAICLTKDLNEYTKFSIMPMRGHYNVTGSGEVFAWQFGFPYCSRPLPRTLPATTRATRARSTSSTAAKSTPCSPSAATPVHTSRSALSSRSRRCPRSASTRT